MFGLFLVSLGGHAVAGYLANAQERQEHGRTHDSFVGYLESGDFLESVAENWESEFLQMAAFVLLSAVLVQRGAAESKKPGEKSSSKAARLHRGGLAMKLYSHSLSLTLAGLFVGCFALHVVAGTRGHNELARMHGQPTLTAWQFLASSDFWFQSFQNWQSEFLSVGVLIVLSIFLREDGSPESKPVHASNRETGA